MFEVTKKVKKNKEKYTEKINCKFSQNFPNFDIEILFSKVYHTAKSNRQW